MDRRRSCACRSATRTPRRTWLAAGVEDVIETRIGPAADSLKGRVVFVEYRKEDPKVPIKLVHKMTEAQVKREAAEPSLELAHVETIEVLPWQHVIIFERRPGKPAAP